MTSRVLKWVAGGLEALLGFPLIGGTIVLGLFWTPLVFMLALHIVALVITINENKKRTGHILGIITSCVGWIPIVGMVMHIISAIFLLIEAGKDEKYE
ncbi:hypothetical protein [Heyndrickxia ginsengihumi]|nr:hypothetical protein [Heyndrickxia ginsengihumi]KHD85375.1 membrane protein [Heyndrickxia ginsengihumi]